MPKPPPRSPAPKGEVLGRRERKKLDTRARILRSAGRLFARKGFDATPVEEIAEAADVSRATLFTYFNGKAALVAELGDLMTDSFVADIEAVRAQDVSTVEKFAAFFEISVERLEARTAFSKALIFETVGRRRDLAERKSRTVRMHSAFADLLRDGVANGDTRCDIEVALIAEVVAGAYLEILLTWVTDPDKVLREMLEGFAALLESMLAQEATQ
ncbi:MAG: helix-turn-helix domain-containing protein [Myxococcota bacterium]|jgi:AcrR family transcriptional regulator|nr:helix-turn-helix domain-containing protein [Myxococcota bacterium]